MSDEWRLYAACKGQDMALFFPEKHQAQQAVQAKAICRECPARNACLEYALEHPGEGIWGGTTERERRRIRRRRAA